MMNSIPFSMFAKEGEEVSTSELVMQKTNIFYEQIYFISREYSEEQ